MREEILKKANISKRGAIIISTLMQKIITAARAKTVWDNDNNVRKSLKDEAHNESSLLSSKLQKIYDKCCEQFNKFLENEKNIIKLYKLDNNRDESESFETLVIDQYIKPLVDKKMANFDKLQNQYNQNFNKDLQYIKNDIADNVFYQASKIIYQKLADIEYQLKYNKAVNLLMNNNKLTTYGKKVVEQCIKKDLLRFLDDNSDAYIALVENPVDLTQYCKLLQDPKHSNALYDHFHFDINHALKEKIDVSLKKNDVIHFINLGINYIFERYPKEVKNNLFVNYDNRDYNKDVDINIFATIANPTLKQIKNHWDYIKSILTDNKLGGNQKQYIINFQAMPKIQICITKLQNIHRTLYNAIVLSAKLGKNQKRLLRKIAENKTQIANIDELIIALEKQIPTLEKLCEQYLIKASAKTEYDIQNVLDIFNATLIRFEHDLKNLEY